jgi:hypothetical protein
VCLLSVKTQTQLSGHAQRRHELQQMLPPAGITPAMEPEPELALPAAVQPQHSSQPEPQIAQIAQAASVPAQPAANQQRRQQQQVASMVATCNIGEAEARSLLHQAGWDLPLAADRFMQTQAPAQPPQLELKPQTQTQAQPSDMAAQAKGAVLRVDGAGTAEVNGYYKQDGEFSAANRCFATLIRGWLLPCPRPAHAGTVSQKPKYTKIDNKDTTICARHTPLIRASRAVCCTVVCCLCGGLSCD